MRPVLSRLRAPEWAIGATALALGVSLALDWYGPPRERTSSVPPGAHRSSVPPGPPGARAQSGFAALPTVRVLVLASSLCGLGSWWLQATRRAPAMPICATMITFVVALVDAIWVAIRVAIAPPAAARPRAGAFAGLALALALPVGAYRSMRRDGIHPEDGPERIETVTLGPPGDGADG